MLFFALEYIGEVEAPTIDDHVFLGLSGPRLLIGSNPRLTSILNAGGAG